MTEVPERERDGSTETVSSGQTTDDSVENLIAPASSAPAPSPLLRSVSFEIRQKTHFLHWTQRSLPPSKIQRGIKKSKTSPNGESIPDYAVLSAMPRSKSTDFKRQCTTSSGIIRSLSFANGTRLRSTVQESTDYADGIFLTQLYRQASIRSVLPVLQKIKETKSRKWTVALFSVIAALLATLRGFTLGFSSNASLDLKGEVDELPSTHLFSTTLISIFAALSQVGALFGGPIGGFVADRFGRKCSMLFSGLPYLVGYMIISYAHYSPWAVVFQTLLLFGRFVSGFGMGWASAVVSVYIAEISPVKLRGVFTSINEIMLTIGIILNFGVGSISNFPYFYVSLVAVGIVAVFEVAMIWLPDTPRSLLSKGQIDSAERALRLLRGKKYDIEGEMNEIKKSILSRRGGEGKQSVWREFKKKNVLVPFVYVLVILFYTQGGGISAAASYAAPIFSDAGVENPRVTAIYAVGVASLLGNIASFFTVDLVGRKSLLIVSGLGMVIGSIMLGTHFFITRPGICLQSLNTTVDSLDSSNEEPCNSHFAPLAVVSLVLFRFFYSVGWGPVPWLLLSELLPLSVRGVASGIAMFITSGTAALVSGVFLEYAKLVRPWFALWTFSLINLSSAVFVLVFIPETKGKSLEEVEQWFVNNSIPLISCESNNDDDDNNDNIDNNVIV